MHVTHVETSALARKSARAESRKSPLVSDFRKRVDLVHELRELGGPEEFADGGHDRLGVDQVVRHGARHVLMDGHALLHRPLHADQTDAELVL